MLKVKKLVALTVALGCLMGCASCGANGEIIDPTVEDTENLYIYGINRGYGMDWLHAIAADFEAETGINVEVKDTSSAETINSTMDQGPKSTNNTDIYFVVSHARTARNNYQGKWTQQGYAEGLMDLTELYNMNVYGENVKFGDKMIDSFRSVSNMGTEQNPKYYSIPWSTGVMGMTYNIDVFKMLYGDTYEEKLPNTSTELLNLAQDIKGKSGTPFIFPGQLDYFSMSMFNVWWAQYSGYERYTKFYEGLAYDAEFDSYSQSPDIFKDEGRLKAIEAIYDLVNYDSNLYWRDGWSYDDVNFTDLQVRYLTTSNKVAMMPNGDWLENESSAEGASAFGMMKTPVLSSIIDRLSTINDDATLSAVVDYVDGTTDTAPSGVSEDDIKEVRMARNMYASNGLSHTCYVPAYSNAKTNAFKFLTYLASDKALDKFADVVGGGYLPFKHTYNSTNSSPFEKDIASLLNTMVYCGELNISPLFYKAGLNGVYYADDTKLETKLSAKSSSSVYRTPENAWKDYWYTASEWSALLSASGEQ